jgi:hypothetical protein
MAKDFDNHRRIFDGGPSTKAQAMIFKLPPQFEQCSMSISKTRLSSLAQLRRVGAPLRLSVVAGGLGGTLWRSGNDFTAQLGVGRQHAMGFL